MYKRQHHQQIAYALRALNGPLLRENNCLFGGGTVMALRFGEYRESVDIDFLVSNITSYRNLRQLLTGTEGIAAIVRKGVEPLLQKPEIRADQYGIRTVLAVAGQPIKFEIVLEGRIELSPPEAGDEICGIATLTPLDMAAGKLLANSDRWADDGVFNRDVIDLAMMRPSLKLLRQAVAKAETAYGQAILRDLRKAIDRLQQKHDWLERCLKALAMTQPKALVWKNIRSLLRVIP
ncbi:MAG: nucleotidyl transferase AbiEii/AbiGii toxin family protein [Proteobacteria bacterium]|nr:nucleotidyl transferase AbiEii/AbiGii toxin family protein [Pseudomonadota bacterium]MBU1715307.1 nucleotidyl transferase AbiEii/AbiGii toxin family protein [Pseudomonadota bacterium]